MANETIDRTDKEYKQAIERLNDTLMKFSQMHEDILRMLYKHNPKQHNGIVKKMDRIKSALIAVKHELDVLEDIEQQESIKPENKE